jgi:transposase-like protein
MKSNAQERGIKINFAGEIHRDLPEWEAVRTAAYAKLKKTGIPAELIDLVEQFADERHVNVHFFRPKGSDGLRPCIEVVAEERPKKLAAARELLKEALRPKDNTRWTAAEALAFFLRMELRTLKKLERQRSGAAPVRTLGLLPRSAIGEIALDLLDSRKGGPRPQLEGLFRELLNLDVDHGLTRDDNAKKWMAFAIAREPTVATRALARAIGVQPSTVLRWRRSSDFKDAVELNAQEIASMRASAIAADKKLMENILSDDVLLSNAQN